jgi:hypothetical protein
MTVVIHTAPLTVPRVEMTRGGPLELEEGSR